jgi:UPF0716 protein FxsA
VRFFLILFVVLPFAEMFVLIKVGQVLGAPATLGLVLSTAVIGLAILRYQGYSAFVRARQKMQQGTMPTTEMFEGFLLALGAALLLIPGFITDFVGLCCLIPMLRQALIRWSLARFQPKASAHRDAHAGGNILEGEYKREE